MFVKQLIATAVQTAVAVLVCFLLHGNIERNKFTNLLMYVNVILTEIRKSINPRQKGQIIDPVFKTSAAQPSVILIVLLYRSHSRLRIPLNDRFLETC